MAEIEKKIVLIGASIGGLQAITKVLSPLPRDFSLPIIIVQHLADDGGETFKNYLQRNIQLQINSVNEHLELKPGHVYLAPSDQHIKITEIGFVEPYPGPKFHYARPSIDVLFKSAAEIYGSGVIALVLTGSNQDGAEGCAIIEATGGLVFIQNPLTAEGKTMPERCLEKTPHATLIELKYAGSLLWDLVYKQKKTPTQASLK